MFGAVCSGRPIQLATQVENTKYLVTVPNASNVSYITIFLLPNSNFTDPNYTALVYFQLPNSQEFKLLGGLNPLKPSAIYKLNDSKKTSQQTQYTDVDMNTDDNIDQSSVSINIGISIETTAQAEMLLTEEKVKQQGNSQSLVPSKAVPAGFSMKNPNETAKLAKKIVGHAYNFLGSFIDDSGKVPMKAFDNWWEKFRNKLSNNPGFLDELN